MKRDSSSLVVTLLFLLSFATVSLLIGVAIVHFVGTSSADERLSLFVKLFAVIFTVGGLISTFAVLLLLRGNSQDNNRLMMDALAQQHYINAYLERAAHDHLTSHSSALSLSETCDPGTTVSSSDVTTF